MPDPLRIAVLTIFTMWSLGAAATAPRGMVVTSQPLATDAAVEVLKSGGNAIDAAITAALTLGVVDGHNSGIGGGCFILIRAADGKLVAIDGRETAPAGASRDMFVRNGKGDTNLSQTGPLAVATPGALAAYEHALLHFGTRKLPEALAPGIRYAREGFPIDAKYARRLREEKRRIDQFEEARRILLDSDGLVRQKGELLVQPDLARTYEAIGEQGIAWFYRGAFARKVGDWMRSTSGVLNESDFAQYKIALREPLVSTYRGRTVVGFPPPSSGGAHVAQILNILSRFEISDLESKEPAQRVHVMSEAMKLAFADRAHWLGDPDFVRVPRGLLDEHYALRQSRRIKLEEVLSDVAHGDPPRAKVDIFPQRPQEKHTTHIAVADDKGNWVAITQTLNTPFGSMVIVPGTGVILNNQMDDFAIQPGVPNYFGLVGSEANAVAPRKRPLSSMSPTIVLDADGQPIMNVGAAGGPKIITQVVLAISHVTDLHDDLETALKRPRFHHQWSPDVIWIENTFDETTLSKLRKLGHKLDVVSPEGATQAILRLRAADGQTKEFIGVSEPRGEGKAAGW